MALAHLMLGARRAALAARIPAPALAACVRARGAHSRDEPPASAEPLSLADLPWASEDDELIDVDAAHAAELSIEQLVELADAQASGGAPPGGSAAGSPAEALESASLDELARLVEDVQEDAHISLDGAPADAEDATWDYRIRTPPWAQVNLQTCTAVFLLQPPARKETALPLSVHGKEPLSAPRDLELQLLSKLVRRHGK